MKASNKKLGTNFENEFCEYLFSKGFWVHNLAQKKSGQPADVIAVKNNKAYLIDCKVCLTKRFVLSRIEENQHNAMNLWKNCGNDEMWFALKLNDYDIYMISYSILSNLHQQGYKSLNFNIISETGMLLSEWCNDVYNR